MVKYYQYIEAYNKWPRDVDLLEQSTTFMKAIRIIQRTRAQISELERWNAQIGKG